MGRIRTTTIERERKRPPIPSEIAQSHDPFALAALLGLTPTSPLVPVTDRTVLGLPAAWAAVNRISNAVAQMMTGADVLTEDRTPITPRPLIVDRPNVGYGRFTFWKEAASVALMRGNYVAVLTDPDPDGFPQQVVPVPVDAVNAFVNPEGRVVYEIGGFNYAPGNVVHVRMGVTIPGDPWAIGAVAAHRRGLSGHLAQQGMSNDVFVNGAVPSGVVQLDVDYPSDDQVSTVKSAWVSALSGKRTVAVTGKRMTYTPITWNADDAQFIESRQFSVSEMALMFGLRPSDFDATIGGPGLTYANREQDNIQRIIDAYAPVMIPIEEAWSDLLPGQDSVKGNVETLLRSTTRERFETYALGREAGVYADADEVREIEGRPPRPGADETVTDEETSTEGNDR